MRSKEFEKTVIGTQTYQAVRCISLVQVCLILVTGCQLPPPSAPQAIGTSAGLPRPTPADHGVDPSLFPSDPFVRAERTGGSSLNIPAATESDATQPPAALAEPPRVRVDRPVVVRQPVLPSPAETLRQAETAFASAASAEAQQSPGCIDLYYFAAEQAYSHLAATKSTERPDANSNRAWQIYHTALAKMLVNGQQYGRFVPQRGIVVNTPRGPGAVGIVYRGFVWKTSDFNRLLPADDGQPRELLVNIRADGVGVPMVAVRQRPRAEGFLNTSVPFAATAVLRPTLDYSQPADRGPANVTGSLPQIATLELIDPLRVDRSVFAGREVRITRDFSAPLEFDRRSTPRQNVVSFAGADSAMEDGLFMMEPYQPGKIPVVLVHGLNSDRTTWTDLINSLRVDPLVLNRYQFWTFQYSTHKPFLGAAMNLRQQLRTIVDRYDPERQDPALQQMLLIGHSMGGLVSKLQVTHSGTILWDQVANRPFEQVRGDQTTLNDLRDAFFFEPVPMVKRVVFIGTPHGGSSWASRAVGRLASGLALDPPSLRSEHRQLMQANPGVFAPYLQQKIPTSVDLLEPQSPLLAGMRNLNFSPHVQTHSIIGTGGSLAWGEPTDGVVTVASARHPGDVSERQINVRHNDLQRSSESVAEVLRILREHLQPASLPRATITKPSF